MARKEWDGFTNCVKFETAVSRLDKKINELFGESILENIDILWAYQEGLKKYNELANQKNIMGVAMGDRYAMSNCRVENVEEDGSRSWEEIYPGHFSWGWSMPDDRFFRINIEWIDENRWYIDCGFNDEEKNEDMENKFNELMDDIQQTVGVVVEYEACDMGETFGKKNRDALGMCVYNRETMTYKIYICKYLIEVWYKAKVLNDIPHKYTYRLCYKPIEKVICHELAHLRHWRHGKKHSYRTQEIQYLYSKFKDSRKNLKITACKLKN